MSSHIRCASIFLLSIFATDATLCAQDDVADVPSEERQAEGDKNKRYFLIGPAADKEGAQPRGLVVVLPGGDGSAEFQPFVRRIHKFALKDAYLIAQPVAVQWTPKQQIVWPTAKSRVPQMKFTTEEFVAAVIKDVSSRRRIDPKRIFTLSWSSGGPAAYAVALSDAGVTGSFVAMSVFKPDQLPPLSKGKGQAFYLYHSKEDRVCPFRMAEQAARDLEKAEAKVMFSTYDGGHGWRGNVFGDLHTGIQWLEETARSDAKP